MAVFARELMRIRVEGDFVDARQQHHPNGGGVKPVDQVEDHQGIPRELNPLG